MSRPLARRVLGTAAGAARPILRTLRRSLQDERDRRADEWVAAGFDRTLRQEYDLGPEALVFDLGGFEGQWASDIFARYLCPVWVFEPVPRFADAIERRFAANPHVRVFPFGLAGSTRTEEISVSADRSSTFLHQGGSSQRIELRQAGEFLREHGVERIDLVKINIEGGEYELLEHLVADGIVQRISDIQVQFHDFVPDAERRMSLLHDGLAHTHVPTYQSRFVWENWRRKSAGEGGPCGER